MKPDHKRYILDNFEKKTIKQMAAHLKIKERTIQRFIDTQNEKYDEYKAKQKEETKQKFKIKWRYVIIVMLCGLIVYANGLKGEFIWDDNILIRNNLEIRDWGNLKKVVFGNLGGETLYYKHSSYRPVQTLTYMMDYSLWKMNPFGYRLTSLICHLLVAGFLYIFIFKIFSSNAISFVTSLLYVVHPIHTEAVSYVAGRADPLSVVFMLLSLIFYFRVMEKNKLLDYIFMSLCYILGILSRENALMVPVLVFVYHIAMRRKVEWKPVIVYALIAGVYIILRVTETVGGLGLKEPVKTSVFERIPGFFVAYCSYLRLMIAPFELHMEYLRPMFKMSNPKAIMGGVLFMSTIATAVFYRKRNTVVTFGILWFLVCLFPLANVFFVVNAYMAEHWLYIPSMGLFLIVAKCVVDIANKNPAYKTAIISVVTVAVMFYGFLTIQQNKTWVNQIEFYERTREFAPNSGRLHADLGEAYFRVGRIEDARDSTIRAIQIRPNYYAAWSNLGTIYVRLKEQEKAIEAYKNSLMFRPSYFNAHFNLGNVYKDKGEYKKAITHYQQAIKYMPSLANAYNNMAICYSKINQKDKAVEYYRQGIMIQPKNIKFYNNLGSVLSDMGRHKEAVDVYKKAVAIGGNTYDAAIIQYNLSLGYFRLKDKQNAMLAFQNANQIPLKSSAIYTRLAAIYEVTGMRPQAKILFDKAQILKKQGK